MRDEIRDQQLGVSGGLNVVTDPAFLTPDQARQLSNMRLTTFGAAGKRNGTQRTSAALVTTNSVVGGISWQSQYA